MSNLRIRLEDVSEGFNNFLKMDKNFKNFNLGQKSTFLNFGKQIQKQNKYVGCLDTHNNLFLNHRLNEIENEIKNQS